MMASRKDYSGAFNPAFSIQQLDHATLAWYGREVMIANHIHDRGIMPLVTFAYGTAAQTKVACDEWMGCSPIYNARNRQLLNIEGDDVGVIFKAFQLDIGAPHTFLNFHYALQSATEGQFWLTSCGAYNHVRRMSNASAEAETQICHHMEDPTFDATVLAVNQGARCRPVFRPPHGDVPAEGPCRWRVFIDEALMLPEANPLTAVVQETRAANFEFAPIVLEGDGMADYAGPFKADFRLEDFDHAVLARQCKEFQLNVNLLMRASYTSILRDFGEDVLVEMAARQWRMIAPVYVHRLRHCLAIQGNDMAAILKLLQVDPYFPLEYVITGAGLLDNGRGQFWVEDCAALQDEFPQGLLMLLQHEKGEGIAAPVQAANPLAQVHAIAPQDCTLAKGKAVLAWEITIDANARPAEPDEYTSLVVGADMHDHDASVHNYHY